MIFITLLLAAFIAVIRTVNVHQEEHIGSKVKQFLDIPVTNADDRFQRALLEDAMDIFYPDQTEKNDTIVQEILSIKDDQFNEQLQKSHEKRRLSFKAFIEISLMYVKFLVIYIIVMLLTYYGVQTIASWRFIREKYAEHTHIHFPDKSLKHKITFSKSVKSFIKTLFYLVFFSPAYVIAYSIRTEFNTDSVFFMIFLAVVSNGLLITYTNKFRAFLISESRKGYIDTARVKNLNEQFTISDKGITPGALLSPVKNFKGHLFNHIFKNAHFQYLSTLKEQASFLITGLIIIEMALNIHGYLNYEMLRQILYKNYELVVLIAAYIFYTVKFTEIFTDYLMYREMKKYENR